MSWTQSLIRLSGYEVETLQKRLAEIDGRVAIVVDAIAVLDAEEAVETGRARLAADRSTLELEAQGVRDALAQAFEAQKKYEHVAAAAAATLARAEARREGAALDELARRRGSAA